METISEQIIDFLDNNAPHKWEQQGELFVVSLPHVVLEIWAKETSLKFPITLHYTYTNMVKYATQYHVDVNGQFTGSFHNPEELFSFLLEHNMFKTFHIKKIDIDDTINTFCVVSDVHLEFMNTGVPDTNADALVIAGDLSVVPAEDTFAYKYFVQYLTEASKKFKHVFYITGNHEYYQGSFDKTNLLIEKTVLDMKNVHFLTSNKFLNFNNCQVYGDTAWVALNNPVHERVVVRNMNDFSIIKNFGVERCKAHHATFVEGLTQFLAQESGKPKVVVSHHAPCHMSIHQNYRGYHDIPMNDGYYTELTGHFTPDLKLWFHGHTHNSFDYEVENTRVICNPRGYAPNDLNREYDESKTFSI